MGNSNFVAEEIAREYGDSPSDLVNLAQTLMGMAVDMLKGDDVSLHISPLENASMVCTMCGEVTVVDMKHERPKVGEKIGCTNCSWEGVYKILVFDEEL